MAAKMMTEKRVCIFTVFPDQGDKTPITILMTEAELENHIRQLQQLLAKEFGYNYVPKMTKRT
jgi:hypothetical protein